MKHKGRDSMNNLNHEADPRIQKLHDFIDKYKLENKCDGSIFNGHNIYLIRSEDRDGNITGEAFALNVTKDNYFYGEFDAGSAASTSTSGYATTIFIGDGEYDVNEDVDPATTTFRHTTYSGSATISNVKITKLNNSTVYWDNDNQWLYVDSFIISGYYDYNLSGITTDMNITEIGIGTSSGGSINNLALHALVYDTSGQRTTFVKHINEKVTISVYLRVYYKPGYIENKMFNNGIEFAFNPWAFIGFGWTYTTGWDTTHVNNTAGYAHGGYISSPRYNHNYARSYYEASSLGTQLIGQRYLFNGPSADTTNKIISFQSSWTGMNLLIEAANRYVDKIAISAGSNYYDGSSPSIYFTNQIGLSKEIFMDNPEELTTSWAHTRSIDSGSLVSCFGTNENSTVDVRGLLPVTNMTVTSVKAYNGLTHEYDIDMPITNGTNDYNLSAMFLYTWAGMYMYAPYMENGLVKHGRQMVRIYCNVHTDYPITAITNWSSQIWCSDKYWDTTSWQVITNNNSLTTDEGTKRYYMMFGGSYTGDYGLPNSTYHPINVRRAGYTEPSITIDPAVRTADDIDPPDTTTEYTSVWYLNGYYRNPRYFISNDTMGYIWMNNHIWYPAVNDGAGKFFTIQTSQPVGAGVSPSSSLRFGESTGHRILQIFRGSANNTYERNCLSKLVVFDMPDETAVEADPTLEPTEYILNTTMPADCTNYATKFSTTETGYVVIGDAANSRTHIVHLLGDAGSNYKPYEEILTYPGTSDEVETHFCFAIKYTSKVIFQDPNTTTDQVRGFTIIDVSTNTIVDQFTVDKSYWYDLRWIVGASDVIFIIGQATSSATGEWRTYIYDLNRPAGDRLVNSDYSSTLSKALMPCGDKADSYSGDMNEAAHFNPFVHGDEECIIAQYVENSMNGTAYFWYINLSDYGNPININGNLGIPSGNFYRDQGGSNGYRYFRTKIEIFKFNNNKQRIIVLDSPVSTYWYEKNNSYGGSNIKHTDQYTYVFDANRIRDTKSGPSRTNAVSVAVPSISNDWTDTSYTTFNQPLRSTTMFRGKLLFSEYVPYFTSNGNNRNVRQPYNRHRWVDPASMIPYRMTGTTLTVQTWNNPKRIYGFQSMSFKLINDATKWSPEDLNPGE